MRIPLLATARALLCAPPDNCQHAETVRVDLLNLPGDGSVFGEVETCTSCRYSRLWFDGAPPGGWTPARPPSHRRR